MAARSPARPHRQGRGRSRDRATLRGRAGELRADADRHDWSLEPKTPNYLTLIREAGMKVHAVGKIRDIFAGVDIDESRPTRSNVDGINQTEELLQELDQGLVFTNLVETDMLWGHRNDPVNFHRCLQDFDRRLPDLLAGSGRRPADHHVRPRLRSDDSVDRPLARARAAARVRRGQERDRPDPRGGVRGRGRDGERMARRQATTPRDPRRGDRREEANVSGSAGADRAQA